MMNVMETIVTTIMMMDTRASKTFPSRGDREMAPATKSICHIETRLEYLEALSRLHD